MKKEAGKAPDEYAGGKKHLLKLYALSAAHRTVIAPRPRRNRLWFMARRVGLGWVGLGLFLVGRIPKFTWLVL